MASKREYAVAGRHVEEMLGSMATLTSLGGERRAAVTYGELNEGVYKNLNKARTSVLASAPPAHQRHSLIKRNAP